MNERIKKVSPIFYREIIHESKTKRRCKIGFFKGICYHVWIVSKGGSLKINIIPHTYNCSYVHVLSLMCSLLSTSSSINGWYWKLNSKQLLCKTLNSRMIIIETRAVLNIIQKDRKLAPEAKRKGLELIQRCFSPLFSISRNFVKRNLILRWILRKLALQGGTLGYKKNEPVWSKSQ